MLNQGLEESAACSFNCSKACCDSSTLLVLATAPEGRGFSLHPVPLLQGCLCWRQPPISGTGLSCWIEGGRDTSSTLAKWLCASQTRPLGTILSADKSTLRQFPPITSPNPFPRDGGSPAAWSGAGRAQGGFPGASSLEQDGLINHFRL